MPKDQMENSPMSDAEFKRRALILLTQMSYQLNAIRIALKPSSERNKEVFDRALNQDDGAPQEETPIT